MHMTNAVVRAFKPTRSRVLTAVCFLAILFGCYGLFTAQQARSATLAKKAFAGVKVVSGTATLVHPNHVTAIVYNSAGQYLVTFDRHVDNCSFAVTSGFHSGVFALAGRVFSTTGCRRSTRRSTAPSM
jgi:hypothetical protein